MITVRAKLTESDVRTFFARAYYARFCTRLITEEFDKTGIKYTPEQIVPNKVDISKPVSDAFATSLTANQGNLQNVQTQNDNVPPQIIRRGGLNNIKPDATLNTPQNTEYKAPINSEKPAIKV